MSIDLLGWIEARTERGWQGVVDLSKSTVRDYQMFSCLFGIRRTREHLCAAFELGPLPSDISAEAKADLLDPLTGASAAHSTAVVSAVEFLEARVEVQMPWRRLRTELHFRLDDGTYVLKADDYDSSILTSAEREALKSGDVVTRGRWRYVPIYDLFDVFPSENWMSLYGQVEAVSLNFAKENVRIVVGFS